MFYTPSEKGADIQHYYSDTCFLLQRLMAETTRASWVMRAYTIIFTSNSKQKQSCIVISGCLCVCVLSLPELHGVGGIVPEAGTGLASHEYSCRQLDTPGYSWGQLHCPILSYLGPALFSTILY
jgi:hypothetical protein